MFVRDYMTKHPVLVEPTMSTVEAQGIMAETNIRHLPVVETGKRLVGLVTRERLRIPAASLSSLNVWEITRFLSNLAVKDVMVKGRDVITIGPDATLEAAAETMARHKIGCLPVVEEGIITGILTEVDLLVQLAGLLGAGVSGVRVTIRVPDRLGEFAKITSAIASKGWGIYASGGLPTPKQPETWDIVIKVRLAPQEELIDVLQSIEGHQVIDVRET
ncbi:MAG: CBS domain-containing protein [Anaerolineae bacterium]|nr:CBS domain-containing protein [Anaerolineae bacterium]